MHFPTVQYLLHIKRQWTISNIWCQLYLICSHSSGAFIAKENIHINILRCEQWTMNRIFYHQNIGILYPNPCQALPLKWTPTRPATFQISHSSFFQFNNTARWSSKNIFLQRMLNLSTFPQKLSKLDEQMSLSVLMFSGKMIIYVFEHLSLYIPKQIETPLKPRGP